MQRVVKSMLPPGIVVKFRPLTSHIVGIAGRIDFSTLFSTADVIMSPAFLATNIMKSWISCKLRSDMAMDNGRWLHKGDAVTDLESC